MVVPDPDPVVTDPTDGAIDSGDKDGGVTLDEFAVGSQNFWIVIGVAGGLLLLIIIIGIICCVRGCKKKDIDSQVSEG